MASHMEGKQYRREIEDGMHRKAAENGLVIVYGASDDLMEFDGAIRGAIDCYDGGTAYLTEDGLFESECVDDNCPYAERERAKCKAIKAIWCTPGGGSWAYETDIPHAKFNIYEDGELYCVGIVFEMTALK